MSVYVRCSNFLLPVHINLVAFVLFSSLILESFAAEAYHLVKERYAKGMY